VYKLNKIMKIFFKILAALILMLLLILSIPYYKTKIYSFSTPEKFSGNIIYNPYENFGENLMKGNFHDHTGTWNPIDPNRKENVEKLFSAYDSKGYDFNCLSEYNRIVMPKADTSRKIKAFPCYEHGYNCNKFHQILVGSETVNYFDFPVYIGSSMRQTMIDDITDKDLMVLAHPIRMYSVRLEDMINLGGYDAMEILNYTYVATKYWDTALSAGNLVWGVATDDTHDYSNPEITFINWTWVDMQPNLESLCNSVKNGRAYMVKGKGGVDNNKLQYCRMKGNYLEAKFENKADTILVIGDEGEVKSIKTGTDKITCQFTPTNTYLRVEAHTAGSIILLNPLIRTKTGTPTSVSQRHPDEIKWGTRLVRVVLFMFDLLILILLAAVFGKKKQIRILGDS
jgi:hypothetical protein